MPSMARHLLSSPAEQMPAFPSSGVRWRLVVKLQFCTLGRFDLYIDDVCVGPDLWGGQQAQTLCKILVTFRGRPVAKRQLQTWLWPDLEPEAQQQALATLTRQLRRVLPAGQGHGLIDVGSGLMLLVEPLAVDTDRLYAAAELDIAPPGAVAALEAADDLYQGAYLPDDAHTPWVIAEAERVAVAYERVLLNLADAYALRQQYAAAALACRSALLFNPESWLGLTRLARYRSLAAAAPCGSAWRQGRELEGTRRGRG